MLAAPDIPGVQGVVEWFGYWPTFHDAEVLSVELDHVKGFRVSIHAFEITPEVDSAGFFVLKKHAIVTFHAEGFPQSGGASLETFGRQNILGGAHVEIVPEGFALVLESSVGASGSIVARDLRVSLEPWCTDGHR